MCVHHLILQKTLRECIKMEPGQESRSQSGTVLWDRVSCCGAQITALKPAPPCSSEPHSSITLNPAAYNLAWSRLTPVKNSQGSQTLWPTPLPRHHVRQLLTAAFLLRPSRESTPCAALDAAGGAAQRPGEQGSPRSNSCSSQVCVTRVFEK